MRVVAFDLETTNLGALMGRILCASFCPIGAEAQPLKPYTLRADEKRFRSRDKIDDAKLAAAVRDELEKYHLLVSWNGKLFDQPFLQARLTKAGLRLLKPQFHLDLMYQAKGGQRRIGSAKLVNVQKFLGLGEAKTEISWEQWQRAAAFDRAALDEVVKHCEQDVKVLAQAYWRLLDSVAVIHR